MVFPSGFPFHARDRHGSHCGNDRGQTPDQRHERRRGIRASLTAAFLLGATCAGADAFRIATLNAELDRTGPGLLLKDLLDGDAPDISAAVNLIARAQPDVIAVQGLDFDHGQIALTAFRESVADAGWRYPYQFTAAPNSGLPTDMDLDNDGYFRGPKDAHSYGTFAGQGGMAVLSRWPIALREDFTALAWRDAPDTLLNNQDPGFATRRLSTVGHWVLEVTPDGADPISLLVFHASPPVFDGPEDLNGRRNHDEVMLWLSYLNGRIGTHPPRDRFALVGVANADPVDGDARREAIAALLTAPALQDPGPRSDTAVDLAAMDGGVNARHGGDPAFDTANWKDDGPGNLRVDYVLPSADWRVRGSGVIWADPAQDGVPALRHGLVWVDLDN